MKFFNFIFYLKKLSKIIKKYFSTSIDAEKITVNTDYNYTYGYIICKQRVWEIWIISVIIK